MKKLNKSPRNSEQKLKLKDRFRSFRGTLKLFTTHIKTKDGRGLIRDYLLGNYREFLSKNNIPLMRSKVVLAYVDRFNKMVVTECKNYGECPDCGCPLPKMLWVKDCKTCEQLYNNHTKKWQKNLKKEKSKPKK